MGPKIYFASVTLPKFEPLLLISKFGSGSGGIRTPEAEWRQISKLITYFRLSHFHAIIV